MTRNAKTASCPRSTEAWQIRSPSSQSAFNHWSEKLWQAAEEDIDTLLDEFWQKNEVAGSGTSLPTAILYLRDPDRYAVWIPAMEHGVKTVLPTLKLQKRRTAAGYRVFNDATQGIREQLALKPQAMDVVLTLASKEENASDGNTFETLFREFVDSFADSNEGQEHLALYAPQKEEAKKNFQDICEMESSGESITDAVLLKLLPYTDTESNRGKRCMDPCGTNGHRKRQAVVRVGWMDQGERLARRREDYLELCQTVY